jgi:hypothetical protein
MLLYFGNVTGYNGTQPKDFSSFSNFIRNASFTFLDLPAIETSAGFNYTSSMVANTLIAIQYSRKPVYIRIGLAPSVISNTTALRTVELAKLAMQSVKNLFLSYGLQNFLAGFVLNNVFMYNAYSDNSRLTSYLIDELVVESHSVHNLPVAIIGDPPQIILSKSKEFGKNPAYLDSFIHVNPIMPWHLYNKDLPELVIDVSRFISAFHIMKTRTNVRHFFVQSYLNGGSPDSIFYPRDEISILKPAKGEKIFNNISRFFSLLGLDFCLTVDTSHGALTNCVYDSLEMIREKKVSRSSIQLENNQIIVSGYSDNAQGSNRVTVTHFSDQLEFLMQTKESVL